MVYSTRRFVLRFTLYYFVLVFFSPFSTAITSLGDERANLNVFVRLFDSCLFRFVGFLFLLCLERAAVCDCGTPWTFLFPFLNGSISEQWTRYIANNNFYCRISSNCCKSITQSPMARLPWLIENCFWVTRKLLMTAQENKYLGILCGHFLISS